MSHRFHPIIPVTSILLILSLSISRIDGSFLLADTNPSNKTFMYYSPMGSSVNSTNARNICTTVGGSLVTLQTTYESTIVTTNFLSPSQSTAWLAFAPIINVPATSAPVYRYSWPDGQSIDPDLWSKTPEFVAPSEPIPASACKHLIYDQSLPALNEDDCSSRHAVVCKTEVRTEEQIKIKNLLPDVERNVKFEPLAFQVGKLVSILSRQDAVPTQAQIDKAAAVMKKANIAFEERTKIKLMNQVIEANNSRTAYALTLGYVALGLAFAVILLLIIVVAGTLIRKPDIRLISMSASARKKSNYQGRSSESPLPPAAIHMSRMNGKEVEFTGIVTATATDDVVL